MDDGVTISLHTNVRYPARNPRQGPYQAGVQEAGYQLAQDLLVTSLTQYKPPAANGLEPYISLENLNEMICQRN